MEQTLLPLTTEALSSYFVLEQNKCLVLQLWCKLTPAWVGVRSAKGICPG